MNSVILATTAGILFNVITCVDIISQRYAFQPLVAQYLGQGPFGQYTYGYVTPTSTKNELRDANGVIKGGYSYIDPQRKLQSVHYIADPTHGFIVAASNLPQDLPSVALAKQRHLQKFEAIRAEHAALALSKQASDVGVQIIANVDHADLAANHNLPKDAPVVAYAKQRHLEKYEAIKAEHAYLAAAKNHPQVAAAISNPVHDLPAVARAKAQHLAAFEAIRARDLALQAAKAASEENILKSEVSYIPIASSDDLNHYSYGYVHPLGYNGVTHIAPAHGYSYMDTDGSIHTFKYKTS